MFAVFGIISVAARLASVHPESTSSYRAFPPSEFPPPHPELWRDAAAPRAAAKAYAEPVDARTSPAADRDAKPGALWNAFRARGPLPSASAAPPPHLDYAR